MIEQIGMREKARSSIYFEIDLPEYIDEEMAISEIKVYEGELVIVLKAIKPNIIFELVILLKSEDIAKLKEALRRMDKGKFGDIEWKE